MKTKIKSKSRFPLIKHLIILLALSLSFFGTTKVFAQSEPFDTTRAMLINHPSVGENLVMTAVGGSSWIWTGPGNFYSTEVNAVITKVDSTDSGTYTLQLYDDLTDSTYTFTETIDVQPLINGPTDIVTSKTMYCTSEQIFCSATNTTGFTYTWATNIPGATISQQGQSTTTIFLVNVPSQGLMASIYVTVYDQNSNIIVFEQTSVILYNCCTTAYNVTIVKNESTSTMTPWNTSDVVIVGVLTVDNTYVIPNSVKKIVIIDQPNSYSGITVMAQSSLIGSSNLEVIQGCERMWEEILIKDEGLVSLERTVIRDGTRTFHFNGNTVNPPSSLSLVECTLRDNLIGMEIMNVSPILNIEGNIFEMDSPTLLPPNASQRTWSAAIIKHVSSLNFICSETNLVHDTWGGIFITNSNVSFGEDAFRFEDIEYTSTGQYSGTAILTQNTDGGTYTLEKLGMNNPNIWDFENCLYGIWSQGVDLNVVDNRVNSVKSGILFSNLTASKNFVNIENNTIFASQYGVFLHEINRVAESHITGNEITMDNANPQDRGNAAIKIVEAGNDVPHISVIRSNTITLETANYGIELLNSVDNLVEENVIQMNEPFRNQAGISLTNSSNNTLSCNQVFGVGASYGVSANLTPYGIRATSSPTCTYSFNTVSDTYTGIAFEETCDGTDINHNDFHAHTYGLHYNDYALTGPQYMKGNKWNSACLTRKAIHYGFAPFDRYDIGLGCSPCDPNPSVTPASSWFYQVQINEQYVEPPCSTPENSSAFLENESLTSFDTLVVSDALNYGVFDEEIDWTNSRLVYDKLTTNQTLLSQNPDFVDFTDSIATTTAGQYQEIKRSIVQACNIEPTNQQAQDSLRTARVNLLSSIKQIDYLIASDTNLQLLEYLIDIREGLVNDLDEIATELQNVVDLYLFGRDTQLSGLVSENNSIFSTTTFEYNEARINAIFIESLLNGDLKLNYPELNTVRNIASQCPISGGPAVYLARSIYSLFADTLYLDKQICLEEGILKSKMQKHEEGFDFVITPNPTSGITRLELNKPLDQDGEILIKNCIGESVVKVQLAIGINQINLDLTQLPSGTYFCTVNSVNRTFSRTNKFVIIH
jgi:parallel beta-helix repeat protein